MGDQITARDFCGLCGSFLVDDEDVTCNKCDSSVMGLMANGVKMKRLRGVKQLSHGAVVGRFQSMSDAAKKTGVAISSISRVCAGELAGAGGFEWCYS